MLLFIVFRPGNWIVTGKRFSWASRSRVSLRNKSLEVVGERENSTLLLLRLDPFVIITTSSRKNALVRQ